LRTVAFAGGRESYDQWAQRHFGNETAQRGGQTRDDDGDGISNRLEYLADTNPRDARSKFQIEAGERKSGGFELRWEGKAGIKYRVLWSGNLTSWSEVPNSRRTGKGQSETLTDSDTTGGRKFYRIEVVE
jgi:hypothetical protein